MFRARPDESPQETLDRNWSELLQELRVVQTGVQLLTGFLLTLPFQQRFQEVSAAQEHLYLATVSASTLATVLLVAPVPLHRVLFRQHERELLVVAAHWSALLGSFFLAVAVTGVTALVFSVVVGRTTATIAAASVAGVLVALWLVLPLTLRLTARRHVPDDDV